MERDEHDKERSRLKSYALAGNFTRTPVFADERLLNPGFALIRPSRGPRVWRVSRPNRHVSISQPPMLDRCAETSFKARSFLHYQG
jgi:hypothetical protein